MRLILSDAAASDLEAIGDYIAQDSPLRADSFVQELLDRCKGLSDHPLAYPVLTLFRGDEVRRAPHRNYLILYSVSHDRIRIHHVVHSSRDYMRLLFPDD